MIEMNPQIENDKLTVEALERGQSLGSCTGHLQEDKLVVSDISCSDIAVLDGLVRTVLHSAAIRGIEQATFDVQDKTALIRLGFVQDNDNTLHSISEILTGCKKCAN